MQQNTSVSTSAGNASAVRFRPTLVFSADGDRRTVEGWMRTHGLWRTSLYHLLQRHPELRLSIEGDELAYRAVGAGGFAVRLAQGAGGSVVHAGGLTARFTETTHAVGIFCAAVSGAARIVVTSAGHGVVEHRLQLAQTAGAWVDVVVARDWCEQTAGAILVNPPLVPAR